MNPSSENAPGPAEDNPRSVPKVGEPFAPGLDSAQAIGIDAGSSLVKVCLLDPAGQRHLATWLSPATEEVLSLIERTAPERLGLTGSGAREIAAALGPQVRPVPQFLEFDAWGKGANALLGESEKPPAEPYLLVSIGTGTSMMRVDNDRVERVGGTALGGGTILGLGSALTDCRSHDELVDLAARGERGRIDLLISDVYEQQGVALAADATASSFGKLAHSLSAPERHPVLAETGPASADLAAAAVSLVAENIVLLCAAHAKAHELNLIAFGGGTIAGHPALGENIAGVARFFGFEVLLLPDRGHAGAIGAMLMADAREGAPA